MQVPMLFLGGGASPSHQQGRLNGGNHEAGLAGGHLAPAAVATKKGHMEGQDKWGRATNPKDRALNQSTGDIFKAGAVVQLGLISFQQVLPKRHDLFLRLHCCTSVQNINGCSVGHWVTPFLHPNLVGQFAALGRIPTGVGLQISHYGIPKWEGGLSCPSLSGTVSSCLCSWRSHRATHVRFALGNLSFQVVSLEGSCGSHQVTFESSD